MANYIHGNVIHGVFTAVKILYQKLVYFHLH